MPRQSYRTLDDDIEDLGVFECLDDETPRFVPAPPPPPLRIVYDEALLARLRLELPMLWIWLGLSCLFYDAGPWLVWGAGLIACNLWLRPAYHQRGLAWLFKVYMGAGLGQIALGLTRILNFTALQPLLGIYILGLLFLWIVLELRYQNHLPPEPIPRTEDDQIYFFYG